jgi:DNA primase
VLYRLPELTAAMEARRTILIVEGEKDVDALVKHGFASSCNPLGAKLHGSTWLPDHTETLRGAARVVVIADKDKPGCAHARAVACALHGVAKSVKLIELPDRDGKPVKDSADFFAAGGNAVELREIVENAPEFIPTSEPCSAGQNGGPLTTRAQWLAEKYPSLADEYGDAILEESDKDGMVSARDIGEDFFAATLGEKGSPNAPTVFLPTEEKFYGYLAQ